jgi:hypothetical protein
MEWQWRARELAGEGEIFQSFIYPIMSGGGALLAVRCRSRLRFSTVSTTFPSTILLFSVVYPLLS